MSAKDTAHLIATAVERCWSDYEQALPAVVADAVAQLLPRIVRAALDERTITSGGGFVRVELTFEPWVRRLSSVDIIARIDRELADLRSALYTEFRVYVGSPKEE